MFDLVAMRQESSICLPNKFPGDADCGPPLEKHSAESSSLTVSPS